MFYLSATVDFLVAASVLFVPRLPGMRKDAPAGIGLRRLLWSALLAGMAFAVKFALLRSWGVDFFGLIHLLYLDLVVVVPALGVVVVAAGLRARGSLGRSVSPTAWCLCLASMAMPPVGIYASFIEPFRLQLETQAVPLVASGAGSEPLRVGVLADIQTDRVTDHERHAIERMMEQKPDIILMPGDLFQGDWHALERELPALRELLGRLTAPGGVYFVAGNTDGGRRAVERILAGSGVELLVNEMRTITVKDRRVTIAGLEAFGGRQAYRETIRRLEDTPGEEDVRILLGHFPRAVLELSANSRIDLVVAGHTHGGQVQLPFIGPPITLSRVPRRVAAGGLHELQGRRIYVSRGVGWERGQAPRLRFLCPPEITLLTLK